jgi:hypothetical protein
VYLAFSHMHVPIVHSPRYSGKSGGKGVLGDALVELDDAVGILLKGLDTAGVRDNTIIFVTGDNGPPQVYATRVTVCVCVCVCVCGGGGVMRAKINT